MNRLGAFLRSRPIRLVGLMLAISLLVLTFASQWAEIAPRLHDFSPVALLLSLVTTLGGIFASLVVWRSVLAGLGFHLPVVPAMRAFFVAQLGKYVPGSVWPVVAQMEVARRYGVPRATTGVAAATVMVLTTVAGAAVGLASLIGREYTPLAIGLIGVGLVVLHPAVFGRLLKLASRMLRRDPVTTPVLDARHLMAATFWTLLMWLLFGLHILSLGWAFGLQGLSGLLAATGAFAAAWTIGFVAVVAPAGAGVRDALLVALLAPAMGVGAAGAIALVSRLLMTASDAIWAGIALALGRSGSLAREEAAQASPIKRPGSE